MYAVAKGEVVALAAVNDPVFSQKMMGDGFAVIPETDTITAPVAGKIVSVFPTKHAIGMETAERRRSTDPHGNRYCPNGATCI